MKVTVLTLALVIMAGSAIAQHSSSNNDSGPRTTTRDEMTSHQAIGTVDSLTPGSNITIVASAFSHPVKYLLGKEVRYENQSGANVDPNSIRAGAKVSLDFGADKRVDRVIMVDATGER